MYAFLAISCAAIMIAGFFLCGFAIKWRMNLSFACLIGCAFCVPVGGFMISEAVGFFTLAGVLLMIALLFGYDNRGS